MFNWYLGNEWAREHEFLLSNILFLSKYFVFPIFSNKLSKSRFVSFIFTEQTKMDKGNQELNNFFFFAFYFLIPIILLLFFFCSFLRKCLLQCHVLWFSFSKYETFPRVTCKIIKHLILNLLNSKIHATKIIKSVDSEII